MLKKTDGTTVTVPLERLSREDREFLSGPMEQGPTKAETDETLELSHDSGEMAGKMSLAGSGHAVKFKVDGDSYCVTSVSLHGSRYGEPRPPKEKFKVWICDSQFQPIASFDFPYGSFARGNPAWKNFRIRPTRVPQEFIICFDFNPHQTKGVFVSHDGKPNKTSMIGVPEKGEPKPFEKGDWLIRCKVKNQAESTEK